MLKYTIFSANRANIRWVSRRENERNEIWRLSCLSNHLRCSLASILGQTFVAKNLPVSGGCSEDSTKRIVSGSGTWSDTSLANRVDLGFATYEGEGCKTPMLFNFNIFIASAHSSLSTLKYPWSTTRASSVALAHEPCPRHKLHDRDDHECCAKRVGCRPATRGEGVNCDADAPLHRKGSDERE